MLAGSTQCSFPNVVMAWKIEKKQKQKRKNTWPKLLVNIFIKLLDGTYEYKLIIYVFMEHGLIENISVS